MVSPEFPRPRNSPPEFSGVITQPPGLMISPPDYTLGIPTDFTAAHRRILPPVVRGRNE